ncbi:MAG: zeta toxin family protein [Pseudomonadota bacterium]
MLLVRVFLLGSVGRRVSAAGVETMNQYRLNAAEHLRIFREGVEAPALAATTPTDRPLAVFLGGQPGCGKSTLARSSCAWFGSANFVHVDVDRVRPMHPSYMPLISNPATERQAPTLVQKDCSAWADMLRESATAGRRNMLVESTMRSPDQVREAMELLRAAGYRIEVRIMAVHEKSSEVSLLQRFEHEKRALGIAREIPLDYHRKATAGIIVTVHALESEKLADEIMVFDRKGHIVYSNNLDKGIWQKEPDGATRMHQFRESTYGLAEKQRIAELWDDVVDMMQKRGAPQIEIEGLVALRDNAHTVVAETLAVGQTLPDEPAKPVLHNFVNVGEFNGRIVEHRANGAAIVQKIGRDPEKIALHAGSKLSRIPDVDEVVDIHYRDGRGVVSERERGKLLAR